MKGEKRGEDDNLEGNPLGLGIGSNHQLMQCNLTIAALWCKSL